MPFGSNLWLFSGIVIYQETISLPIATILVTAAAMATEITLAPLHGEVEYSLHHPFFPAVKET